MMPFLLLLRGVRLKPLLNLEARSSEEILIPDFYGNMVGNKVLPKTSWGGDVPETPFSPVGGFWNFVLVSQSF